MKLGFIGLGRMGSGTSRKPAVARLVIHNGTSARPQKRPKCGMKDTAK
jgi:hypothetical protein